jgi:hypothetical protein
MKLSSETVGRDEAERVDSHGTRALDVLLSIIDEHTLASGDAQAFEHSQIRARVPA